MYCKVRFFFIIYHGISPAPADTFAAGIRRRRRRRPRHRRRGDGRPRASLRRLLLLNLAFVAAVLVGFRLLVGASAAPWVGVVLLAHSRFGLHGKRSARGVLTVYLLLTLAYPGVKAVHALIGE